MRKSSRSTALVVVLSSVGLSAASPAPRAATCLTPGSDLKVTMHTELTELGNPGARVSFLNNAKQTLPALGYQIRVYKFLPGQKTFSSSYITVTSLAVPISETYWHSVPSLRCEQIDDDHFSLRRLRQVYNTPDGTQLRVRLKIVYDRIIRDNDMSNHDPYLDVTL